MSINGILTFNFGIITKPGSIIQASIITKELGRFGIPEYNFTI
jgi:hypothetical protein